jgi:diacylglycerol kinase (ATP)
MKVNFQQKPKTFVVINPVAGMIQAEIVREKIQSILQAHEIPFEIYETNKKENLKQKVRDAVQQGFKLFVTAGGDGTLSGVASGLVDTQIPLVVIPTGTWNALARNLDIPLQTDQALELLFQQHSIRTIDALQVEQNFYILNVSTGVGPQTMREVKRAHKRRFGKLPDLWRGLNQLLRFRSYRFEVKIDGKPTRFRASELIVANSKILGLKALQLDTGIRMDDSKLNVCRIYAESLSDYVNLAISLLTGNQEHNWNVLCLEALREVEIDSREDLFVQGDGEIIGHLPITIKIRPKAIYIVTPVDSET